MRFLLAAALAFALLASACGGSKPAATDDSAALAPADAGLYGSLDSDRDSAQWEQLESLLARVPGAENAVQELLSDALGEAGLNWDEDVEPALGPEVVVVLPGGASEPVALTQPDDEAKLRALLAQSDEKLVSRELEGWTAIAESEAALDAYEKALDEGLLSEQAAFTEAMAGLPEDALARVYVNGSGLQGALGRGAALGGLDYFGVLGGTGSSGAPSLGFGTMAMAFAAEDDGLRLVGNVDAANLPASFSPTLLGKVPADALLAATFKGGDGLTQQLRTALAGYEELVKGFETALGVTLEDIVSLLEGEVLLYVRPGVPIPELTLVLQQTDPKQPATLDALFSALGTASKGQVTSGTEDGVEVTRLALGPVSLGYAATDGLLVVTTSTGGIAALRGGGAKLVDDPAFQTATEAVGYNGSTSALVYADVDGLVPLIQGLAALGGGSTDGLDEVTKALGALDSVAVNMTTQGDQARLEGLLGVR